ncbi:MAG: 50S ribosomal protein L11 methyltransferase [Pygmaiobacter sp.]
MNWTDIKITVPKAEGEIAEAIATGISGSGIYIEDYSDLEQQVEEIAHVDLIEQELRDKDRSIVAVHLYLEPSENPAEVLELLRERLLRAQLHSTLEVSGIAEEDWANGWKAFYHAMELGKRLAICPSWETIDTDRVVLKLDPGMAFGTGTHETTALCLETLDDVIRGGERMLDIGTGSGILAIGALLLGAAVAEGVDIDAMCVRTAAENAALNGVADRFVAKAGNLSDKASGTYDIITANIVANAIIALSPDVKPLLAPGGLFIASGIIDEREAEVASAMEGAGLAVQEIRRKKGWVCILAR